MFVGRDGALLQAGPDVTLVKAAAAAAAAAQKYTGVKVGGKWICRLRSSSPSALRGAAVAVVARVEEHLVVQWQLGVKSVALTG